MNTEMNNWAASRINPRILDLFHTEPQTKLEIVEVGYHLQGV